MRPNDVKAHQRHVDRTKRRLEHAQRKYVDALLGLRWANRLTYLRNRALERPVTTAEEGQDEFFD